MRKNGQWAALGQFLCIRAEQKQNVGFWGWCDYLRLNCERSPLTVPKFGIDCVLPVLYRPRNLAFGGGFGFWGARQQVSTYHAVSVKRARFIEECA